MARTLALALLCGTAAAFGGPRRAARPRRRTALNGETVRVKFRIYPDGRVEETVSGIRGSDCTKVTEELNEKLGKVTQTKPTEEMFQEKVDVKTEVFDQNFFVRIANIQAACIHLLLSHQLNFVRPGVRF